MAKKVIVGLSGGVDSAVAAYLLKQQGYEVVGAFMRNWDSQLNNDILGNNWSGDICPQEVDYNDAKEVARILGIELLRVDFIKEYWEHVFSYFLDEYKKGRTPNPDIMCNKYIKFDSFLKFAKEQGADYVATGHYAKIVHNGDESILMKASDDNKDQSYFLSFLNQEQLHDVLFPLADIDKTEVRRIANELNLNNSTDLQKTNDVEDIICDNEEGDVLPENDTPGNDTPVEIKNATFAKLSKKTNYLTNETFNVRILDDNGKGIANK